MRHLTDYRKLHADGKFPGLTILKYKDSLRDLVAQAGAKTVLDYGSGKGYAWTEHGLGADLGLEAVWCYDPAVTEHCILPDGKFDLVTCVDVLEHVPEAELPHALKSIFDRATKATFFTFCNRPAKKTFPDGTNVHVTQRPGEWWLELIARYNTADILTVLKETA